MHFIFVLYLEEVLASISCWVDALRVLSCIRCNPMHPLDGALPVPYVPVRVTRNAVIAHRYTYAPRLCRISQYRRTFIPLSVSLWNDLSKVKSSMARSLPQYSIVSDPVFDCVGLAGLKSRANAFLLA